MNNLHMNIRKNPQNIELHGKLPPQAIELEEAVLGAIMLEKNAFETVSEILKPESFYKPQHVLVYKAHQSLYNKKSAIDILTTTEELRSLGLLEEVGGAYYVTQLTNRVASAANIEHHARIIRQKYVQRELIRMSGEILTEAYDDTTDVYQLIDQFETQINLLGLVDSTELSWQDHVDAAFNHVDSIDPSLGISGVPSGLSSVDNITKGWQNGELMVLGARPGMGKTAFLVTIAINSALQGEPVDIYSLEMSGRSLVLRALSFKSQVNGDKLKTGQIHEDEWLTLIKAKEDLKKLPIHLDDLPSQKPASIRRKIKKGVKERGTKLILIDYLQLMDGSDAEGGKANRTNQIGHISRTLKGIAKECNVPIIALSSLSRSVEQRGGEKRPMLSDLRESGDIESDSDVVAFLYRPEYYGITEDSEGNSTRGLAEFIVAKHRNGKTDTALLKFDGAFSTFTDWEFDAFEQHLNNEKKDNSPF